MWQPANKDAIPTPEETRCTKESILQMEAELAAAVALLEHTQLRIINLERDLEQQRGWIAPIRRIPFDVLSEIFNLCSREERLAPIMIAAVCRSWRSAILSTPLAWSYINVQNYVDNILPLAYVSLFLDRSRPCLLHLGVRWARAACCCLRPDPDMAKCDCDNVAAVFENPHRIQCLNIAGAWFAEFSTALLPNLTHLTITDEEAMYENNGEASFDMSRFPSLWYLDISWYPNLNHFIDFSNGVQHQLRYLSVDVDEEGRWHSLVGLCAGTLKSLAVAGDFSGGLAIQDWTIDCPRLECLVITEDVSEYPQAPTIEVIAPNLAYFELFSMHNLDSHISLQGHRSTAVHLRTNYIVSLQEYRHLRILQLSTNPAVLLNVVEQLERDIYICSRLELIEVFDHNTEITSLSLAKRDAVWQRLDDRNKRANSNIKLVYSTQWTMESPGNVYECRGDLPCQVPTDSWTIMRDYGEY